MALYSLFVLIRVLQRGRGYGDSAGPAGTPRGGYGAYGESAVSGTELHRVTAGRGHAAVFVTLPLPFCGLIMH